MQKKLVDEQLTLLEELDLYLGLDVPSMRITASEGPGPILTDEEPDEYDPYEDEFQLDLFEDMWAENLKQKYGILHPMSEDE